MLIGDLSASPDMPLSTFLLNKALTLLELYAFALLAGVAYIRQIKKDCKKGKITPWQEKKELQDVYKAMLAGSLLVLMTNTLLVLAALVTELL